MHISISVCHATLFNHKTQQTSSMAVSKSSALSVSTQLLLLQQGFHDELLLYFSLALTLAFPKYSLPSIPMTERAIFGSPWVKVERSLN